MDPDYLKVLMEQTYPCASLLTQRLSRTCCRLRGQEGSTHPNMEVSETNTFAKLWAVSSSAPGFSQTSPPLKGQTLHRADESKGMDGKGTQTVNNMQ